MQRQTGHGGWQFPGGLCCLEPHGHLFFPAAGPDAQQRLRCPAACLTEGLQRRKLRRHNSIPQTPVGMVLSWSDLPGGAWLLRSVDGPSGPLALLGDLPQLLLMV